MLTIVRIIIIGLLIGLSVTPVQAENPTRELSGKQPLSVLTLQEVLTKVEQGHPLLQSSQTQKTVAAGKVLKALGAFEPNLVNDWELERLVKDGKTVSVGFNDTFVEMRHPWGIKGFAGFRAGIGDVEIADLGIDNTNQPLLGIVFPMLRGLMTNPARAELQKSNLADKQADLEIQQARQDLYLGAATQYWNWVAAGKFVEVQEKAVSVADARSAQTMKQADAGARAQFDGIEANQEVQRRRDLLIKARRKLEEEQYRLALFLWEGDNPVVPAQMMAPEFPPLESTLDSDQFKHDRQQAATARPEVRLVNLEAEFNHIDLDVAENNFLPDLTAEAQPTRKPGEFVLGLAVWGAIKFSVSSARSTRRPNANGSESPTLEIIAALSHAASGTGCRQCTIRHFPCAGAHSSLTTGVAIGAGIGKRRTHSLQIGSNQFGVCQSS